MTKKKRLRKEAQKAQKAQSKSTRSTEGNPLLKAHVPDFKNQEHYYVIGVGDPEENLEGAGFYYIEQKSGKRVLPLFSSSEKATRYIEEVLTKPVAYMDILESSGIKNPKMLESLQGDRFFVAKVDVEGFATALYVTKTNAFALDLGPGETQVVEVDVGDR